MASGNGEGGAGPVPVAGPNFGSSATFKLPVAAGFGSGVSTQVVGPAGKRSGAPAAEDDDLAVVTDAADDGTGAKSPTPVATPNILAPRLPTSNNFDSDVVVVGKCSVINQTSLLCWLTLQIVKNVSVQLFTGPYTPPNDGDSDGDVFVVGKSVKEQQLRQRQHTADVNYECNIFCTFTKTNDSDGLGREGARAQQTMMAASA